MDVLAENGELLGQVAIALVQAVKAVAGADAPLRPMVEGVGAAAADADVVARAVAVQRIAQAGQVGGNAIDAGLRLGADLDHALGDFQLDFTEAPVVVHAAEQVGGAAGQVVIAPRDELEFELDAQ